MLSTFNQLVSRALTPELLDALPSTHPLADGSRRDLRKLNTLMGHARALTKLILASATNRRRVAEIGAGDGELMLTVAQRLGNANQGAYLTLVDQHQVLSPATRASFAQAGWNLNFVHADARRWLAAKPKRDFDLLIANLFLHHFSTEDLRELLRLAADRCQTFIALEPRRSPLALAGSRLVWAIGCNSVTRHDAPASVRAGFRSHEISQLWPKPQDWILTEKFVFPFSHAFAARRKD